MHDLCYRHESWELPKGVSWKLYGELCAQFAQELGRNPETVALEINLICKTSARSLYMSCIEHVAASVLQELYWGCTGTVHELDRSRTSHTGSGICAASSAAITCTTAKMRSRRSHDNRAFTTASQPWRATRSRCMSGGANSHTTPVSSVASTMLLKA